MKPSLLLAVLPLLLGASTTLNPSQAVLTDPHAAAGGVSAPPVMLPMVRVDDELGRLSPAEMTLVLKSDREYRAWFGHASPPAIDWRSEWVVFYSGGWQPSSYSRAAILGVELTEGGHALRVSTILIAPYDGGPVGDGPIVPWEMVRIPRPASEIHAVRTSHLYATFL